MHGWGLQRVVAPTLHESLHLQESLRLHESLRLQESLRLRLHLYTRSPSIAPSRCDTH